MRHWWLFLVLVAGTAVVVVLSKDMLDIRHVLVVIAMEAEAMPFVEHLQLQQDTTVFAKNLPFVAYSGYLPPRSSKSSTTITNSQETRTTHDTDTGTWGWSKLVKFLQDTFRAKRKHKVTVVTNGKDTIHGTNVDNVGTVPAAMVTYVALESLQDVDLVMNAGTAGGFAHKGASIADVYVTHTVAHHDRRIPIPDFIPYGIGKVTTHIYQVLDTMALQMGYKIGICTTGNSLDASDQDHVHMTANNASLKDMELAAIAWSCQLHDTPWIGLKVVTDIVNGEVATQDEFLANLAAASQSLQNAIPKVLDYVFYSINDNPKEDTVNDVAAKEL